MNSFFNATEPILRRKQHALDVQDLCGLLRVRFKIGQAQLFSSLYTRVDQAFLLWGWITLIIFAAAQFLPVSWITQAYVWSFLTLVGTVAMIGLTRFWTRIEQLSWVSYGWGGLMIAAVSLTDLGLFCGWAPVLMHLCDLWLGTCALGYLLTGIGLRSRAFLMIGLVHLGSMALLPVVGGWQFLFTGAVMGGSLLLLSEVQWDMRSAIDSPWLSQAEKRFNRQQAQQRQLFLQETSPSA